VAGRCEAIHDGGTLRSRPGRGPGRRGLDPPAPTRWRACRGAVRPARPSACPTGPAWSRRATTEDLAR
jgi:hypothetical protein